MAGLTLGLALAAVAIAPAASHSPTSRAAKTLTFRVGYHVSGHYMSNDTLASFADNEDTDFALLASFAKLNIPAQGPASSTLNIKGDTLVEDGTKWRWFGHVPDLEGGFVNYNCEGELGPATDPRLPPSQNVPHILSGPGSATKGLHLHVQAVPHYGLLVGHAHGTDPVDDGGCGSYNHSQLAFEHASPHVPDLLTADIRVSLKRLRALGTDPRDRKLTLSVSDADAVDPAPSSCSDAGNTGCSQHLSWKGEIHFVRVD